MSRICILMYHTVSEPVSADERRHAIPRRRFASHMRILRAKGYNLLSLGDVQNHLLRKKVFPERAVVVTLDDGYADNYTNAFSILQQYQIPATIFLVNNDLGGKNRWHRGSANASRTMLDWGQIREMHAAGIGFGSHTLSHPRLSELPEERARTEIVDAKKLLEDRLGAPVDHFAYPYGDLTKQTVDLVRQADHTLACTTRCGFNRVDVDPLLLRRIDVYGTDSSWQLLQKVRFGTNDSGVLQPTRYYLRQVATRLLNR